MIGVLDHGDAVMQELWGDLGTYHADLHIETKVKAKKDKMHLRTTFSSNHRKPCTDYGTLCVCVCRKYTQYRKGFSTFIHV